MKNKNAKKLFLSLALTAVAGAMATTSTYAWFSTNRVVNANGIKLAAKSAQSLVISNSFTGTYDVTTSLLGQNADTTTNQEKTTLTPATHPTGNHVAFQAPAAGAEINGTTGIMTKGSLETVTNVTGTTYYQDFVVYVAVIGDSTLSTNSLKVAFDAATIANAYDASKGYIGTLHTAKAYSFDFFVNSVTDATAGADIVNETYYKGTIAFADLFNGTGNAVSKDLGDQTIPLQGNGAIKIVIRAYLDGALGVKATDYQKVADGTGTHNYDTAGKFVSQTGGNYVAPSANSSNYVNTKTASTGVVDFGFEFTAA